MWAEQPGQATDGETVAKLHRTRGRPRTRGRHRQPHRSARNSIRPRPSPLPAPAGCGVERPHLRRGGPGQAAAGGQPVSRRHGCRCRHGANGGPHPSRLAGAERAALQVAARLVGILPRMGCAAVPGDRHRGAAASAGWPDLGAPDHASRAGRSPTTTCCSGPG